MTKRDDTAAVATRMVKLGAAPTTAAPAEAPAPARSRRTPRKSAATPAPAAPAPMPIEQAKRSTYSARINFTTTPEQNRALDLARIEDGIDKTARLRALVDLWVTDERFRNRVNKLAQSWR